MTEAPLISIALCTYNGARFLPAQLDSLLAQDYPSLEVVAVDDASTDETWALLQACAARDARVRVHRNAANLGFLRNFEVALGHCRGELIAPCDQDDVWRREKLRVLQAHLGERAGVYCDSELIDEQGRPLGRRLSQAYPMRPIGDPAALLFDNHVSGHALLLRSAVVAAAAPFPPGLFHDWWLAFVAAGAGGLAFCGEALVEYRMHRGAVTDFSGLRRGPGDVRPRGHALAAEALVEERLRAFAAFGGAQQAFFRALLAHWEAWRTRPLCPGLALFLLRHRDRLFFSRRKERKRRVTRALGYLWGLPARRLVRPHAYART